MLESQCPRIRSFYFYLKAKYGNLYLAPHFDVHIWLQANSEKTNVCKSRIFEIQVFVFDYRQISTRRTFENLRFETSNFSYLTTGEYRKVGFIKVGEKTFAISETSTFSTWPKWRFVLRRSFCLTQKEILKTSKLKPIGLENGHGSKRSLFGHDRDNVTRYEHDVDNVNDDDFYILNKNDLMIQARHVQLKNISQP